MTRCSTSLTNCESRNVNSLDQSEGVHFFLIYQALFEQKDRDGGRSENLDWRVVIRCFVICQNLGGAGGGGVLPFLAPSGFAIPERHSNFAFNSLSTRLILCLERPAAKETEREEERKKNEKEYGTKKGELKGQ